MFMKYYLTAYALTVTYFFSSQFTIKKQSATHIKEPYTYREKFEKINL